MKRKSKKIHELIDILCGVPTKDIVLTPTSRYRHNTDQIIATALAGALITASNGTMYEELCQDIVKRCAEIDRNDIVDLELLELKFVEQTDKD